MNVFKIGLVKHLIERHCNVTVNKLNTHLWYDIES